MRRPADVRHERRVAVWLVSWLVRGRAGQRAPRSSARPGRHFPISLQLGSNVRFACVSQGAATPNHGLVHPVTVGHPQGCAPHAACPGGAPHRTNDLDRRRAVCSACPGRRGRDGPHPLQPGTAGEAVRGPGPSRSPRPRRRHRSFHRSGGGARSRRPVSTNQVISPAISAGRGGGAGDQLQHHQGQPRGDRGAEEQAARTAAADPGRELPHRGQRMPRQAAGRRRRRRGRRAADRWAPRRPVPPAGCRSA